MTNRSNRLASSTLAALALSALFSTACLTELDLAPDQDQDQDVTVGQVSGALQNATSTTAFHPVVRIEYQWTEGSWPFQTTYTSSCTATAIRDDLLITASHCIKSGTSVRPWVRVSKAHGGNSSSEGKYSSYFILSEDIYDNYDVQETNGSSFYKRDIAVIKFGPGTFGSVYSPARVTSSLTGQTVTMVGFGGDSTKEYGTDTVTSTTFAADGYGYARTSQSVGPNTENGDSGGPLLGSNGSGGYELLGVLYGSGIYPLLTDDVYDYIMPFLDDTLPQYCVENYQHTGFGGWSLSFCPHTTLNNKLASTSFSDPYKIESQWNYGVWNDELSSLTMPPDTIVTMYEHNNQGGKGLTFQTVYPFGDDDQISSLADLGFNDRISSWSMAHTTSPAAYRFHIEITRHGGCIDVSDGGSANGTKIQQWSCGDGNTNQMFRIKEDGNYYRIEHSETGKCLDVDQDGTSNGTKIQLWNCNGTAAQQFSITSNSSTSDPRDFKIKGRTSGKCMDLSGGSSANGTQIQIWSCSDSNTNQNFALDTVW